MAAKDVKFSRDARERFDRAQQAAVALDPDEAMA